MATIKVWMPGTYKELPVTYSDVTDYAELKDGGLALTLKNGSRFRFFRLPYMIELEPVKE